MTKHGKRDLLIHYDEDQNELIFYTVAVEDTKPIRAKEYPATASWIAVAQPEFGRQRNIEVLVHAHLAAVLAEYASLTLRLGKRQPDRCLAFGLDDDVFAVLGGFDQLGQAAVGFGKGYVLGAHDDVPGIENANLCAFVALFICTFAYSLTPDSSVRAGLPAAADLVQGHEGHGVGLARQARADQALLGSVQRALGLR